MVPRGAGVLTTVSHDAYEEAGWSEEQISNVLQIQTQMTNGSLRGALPAIIMAAAMWF